VAKLRTEVNGNIREVNFAEELEGLKRRLEETEKFNNALKKRLDFV
jgi:hypothetical protein